MTASRIVLLIFIGCLLGALGSTALFPPRVAGIATVSGAIHNRTGLEGTIHVVLHGEGKEYELVLPAEATEYSFGVPTSWEVLELDGHIEFENGIVLADAEPWLRGGRDLERDLIFYPPLPLLSPSVGATASSRPRFEWQPLQLDSWVSLTYFVEIFRDGEPDVAWAAWAIDSSHTALEINVAPLGSDVRPLLACLNEGGDDCGMAVDPASSATLPPGNYAWMIYVMQCDIDDRGHDRDDDSEDDFARCVGERINEDDHVGESRVVPFRVGVVSATAGPKTPW